MYQARAKHPLSPTVPPREDDVERSMWGLFVAIGKYWALGDDPAPYRQRFLSFMANRIELNPLYRDYYAKATSLLAELASQGGEDHAYETIFTEKARSLPSGPPINELDLVQRTVANEFVALRLALGSFQSFGAVNYCGYFGGANMTGRAAPYRTF
jgi:hypothetical protein